MKRDRPIPAGHKLSLMVVSMAAVLLIGAIAIPVVTDDNLGALGLSLAKKKASISLTFSSTEFAVNSNIHADGVLSGMTNNYNARISLKVTLPDGQVVKPTQGSITNTARDGGFSIDYRPMMSGVHTFTATLVSNQYAATVAKSVSVIQPSSSQTTEPKRTSVIGLTLISSSITTGATMHADGVLNAGAAISGAAIKLQVVRPDGTTANPAQGSTALTDGSGRFSMDYAPTSPGTYGFSAAYDGNELYNASVTSVSFTAASPLSPPKEDTSVELSLASPSIEVNNNLHASGQLKGGAAIAGATVDLKVVLPDGRTVSPAQGASAVTDSQGRFVMDYTPAGGGVYKFEASFAGNERYDGSSVSAPFTAIVPAPAAPVEAKYVVSKVGGTYYAQDRSGATISSGSNAASVINSAINALTPGRTVKETVSLTAGTSYTLISPIRMQSHSMLDATGAFVTAGTSTTFIVGSGITDFEVVGGDWDARGMADGSGTRVVSVSSCNYGGIRNMFAHDHYYDCFEITSSNHITVSGVEIGRVGHTALVMGNCNDCVVENCHFYDSYGGGGCYFLCEGGTGLTTNNNIIRSNTVERTFLTGLSIASLRDASYVGTNNLAEFNTLTDCGLDGTHPGIACGWYPNLASNCVIRYNNIYETGNYWPPNGNGTQIGIGAACRDSQIYGNVITKTYDGGIMLLGPRNLVHDNTITAVSPKGGYGSIVLTGAANNNEIYNNRFIGPTNYGITTEGSVSGNLIHDNYFEGMASGIVRLLTTTSGNQVINNTYRGIGTVANGGANTISNNIPAP